ncbi:MAG: glycerol-3-phosphate 1-O-acyltransferase PlsY [Akkermansia sp.]|nr:glycerol-3-phosphate 1-O-acyltransferase PlsY [Akkermansia sp.]
MLENTLYIVAAYLIGAIPFGYLAGRLNGIDLREHGSCNIGATNAVRVLGKKWGIPVFLLDFAKGYVPLLLMKLHLGGDATQFGAGEMGWFLGVMFALVMGHTYTCYLGFKGGKGVATTAGCLLALSPLIGGCALAAWVLFMALTRYVSLSSMLAGVVMLLAGGYEFWWADAALRTPDAMVLGLLTLIFILVVYKHRSNIVRLCRGTEPKAFSKKS